MFAILFELQVQTVNSINRTHSALLVLEGNRKIAIVDNTRKINGLLVYSFLQYR